MSDVFIETPAEPAESRLPIIAAILLGIAATLTAVSAYQAALEDGDSIKGYAESTRLLNDANFFFIQGNQTTAEDQALFVEYALSTETDPSGEIAAYLETLMSPELLEAVEWWKATDDALTPFDELEGNPYTVADYEEGQALEDQASQAFEAGAAADDKGDEFELATVLLALTLFFAGIATLFRRRVVSIALLVVGATSLVLGAGQLLTAFGT